MKELRIVLVEDEPVTARHLSHLLQSLDPQISIAAVLSSVVEAMEWFAGHEDDYELAFMDIRLADGLSFDIFKGVPVKKPVIFVTAYNDYAIQAFKNNGIDYILKPFDERDVRQALDKFERLLALSGQEASESRLARLLEQFTSGKRSYKRSFLVHHRDKLIPLESATVAWLHTANELVYAHTADGRQFIMEFTLEQLEQLLDPQMFFRANRQFIINRRAIGEVGFYFNGRLSVKVTPAPSEPILISKARVPEFKSWMNS